MDDRIYIEIKCLYCGWRQPEIKDEYSSVTCENPDCEKYLDPSECKIAKLEKV